MQCYSTGSGNVKQARLEKPSRTSNARRNAKYQSKPAITGRKTAQTLSARQNCNNKTEEQEQSVTVKAWAKRQMLKQNCKNRAESNTNFKYQAKLKNKAEKQVPRKTLIALRNGKNET